MPTMGDAQRVGQGGLSKLTDGPRTTSDLSKVGGGLTRGPNQGKKLNAAAWSETWPAAGSTLDLDFANDRGWVRGVGQGKSMDAVTFTRASSGTFVGEDGLLKTTVVNYLGTTSNDFSAWVVDRGSLSYGEADPFGGQSATKFLENGTTGNHGVRRVLTYISANQPTVLSAYVKPIGNDWFYVQNSAGGGTAYFNFSTESVGTTGGGAFSYATIENIGDGWYRLAVATSGSGVSGTQTISFYGATADTVVSYTGNINNGFYIAFAQWELGSVLNSYTEQYVQPPRFDWASTAQVANRNLLTYTENFDNAQWTKLNVTVTANTVDTIDPFGGNTADVIFETVTTGDHTIYNATTTVVAGETYTYSAYVKANGRTKVRFGGVSTSWGSQRCDFDLSAVTATANNSSGIIIDETNGWYRCIWTATAASNQTGTLARQTISCLDDSGNLSYAGDVTKGIFIWGAQLELGDTATTYQSIAQPTTSTSLAANATSNGLLIEESRANRILWCRDATQANWTKTNVTAAKDQTGVDGVANAASSLTATANDGTCIQTITLASGSRTGSVYLKRLTGTGNVQVSLDGSTYSTVDLSASEWRRIVISGTVTNPTVGIKIAVSGDAVAMDYGQVEDGAFVTSPILTTTASVTRAADVASMSVQNVTQFFNPNEGIIVSNHTANQVSSAQMIYSFRQTGVGAYELYTGNTSTVAATIDVIAGRQCAFATRATVLTGKSIFAYKASNYYFVNNKNIFANTVLGVASEPLRFVPLSLGSLTGSSSFLNGWIKQIVYFPKQAPLSSGTINL